MVKVADLRIRRLETEEVRKRFPKRGQMNLTEYVELLRDVQPNDAMEIELPSNSTPRALKRRFGTAAREIGFRLQWERNPPEGRLAFRVRPPLPTGDGKRQPPRGAAARRAK